MDSIWNICYTNEYRYGAVYNQIFKITFEKVKHSFTFYVLIKIKVGKQMNIVIAGVGKLGGYLAKLLVKEKNDVTLIDYNFFGKESLINNEDLNDIEGNALNIDTLKEARSRKRRFINKRYEE